MTSGQGPLTISEAAAAMLAGRLTPVQLFDQCLARIERYEPAVRAWVVIDRDGAREQALRLTDDLNRGRVRGPLHGIPVGIKDIIDVADLPTGCGSRVWANNVARQDAECVRRLRAAGAVILGKTVTTAYAYLDPPVTRNPWDLSRTPGGSSSGSAAAVACGMCLAALGSQTGGSITRPAAYCGVAGCKPSWGSVSVDGVLPLAPSLDHVGVMARSVADAATTHRALAAIDRPGADPTKPIRLGRLWGPFEQAADPEVWQQLSAVGGDRVEIVDLPLPPRFGEIWPSHRAIMAVEAAGVHGERLRRHPDDYPPKIRGLVEHGLLLGEIVRTGELARRERLRRDALPLFDAVDALMTPAATDTAPDPATTGDPMFNAPWSYLGWPTVSFPIGTSDGLPLAVQLIGRPDGDADLLTIAEVCEARFGQTMGLPPPPA